MLGTNVANLSNPPLRALKSAAPLKRITLNPANATGLWLSAPSKARPR